MLRLLLLFVTRKEDEKTSQLREKLTGHRGFRSEKVLFPRLLQVSPNAAEVARSENVCHKLTMLAVRIPHYVRLIAASIVY